MIAQRFFCRHFRTTGSGTGKGHAIALRLAADGAALSLLGWRVELVEETSSLFARDIEAKVDVARGIRN